MVWLYMAAFETQKMCRCLLQISEFQIQDSPLEILQPLERIHRDQRSFESNHSTYESVEQEFSEIQSLKSSLSVYFIKAPGIQHSAAQRGSSRNDVSPVVRKLETFFRIG